MEEITIFVHQFLRKTLRSSTQIKEFGATATGVFLNAVMGLFTIKILTNSIDKKHYSGFILASTIASLSILLFFGPLSNAISRYFAQAKNNQQLAELRLSIRHLIGQVGVVIFAILLVLVLYSQAIDSFPFQLSHVICGLILSFPLGLAAIQEGLYSANRMRLAVILIQLLSSTAKVFAILIVLKVIEPSGELITLTVAVSTFLVASVNWKFQRKIFVEDKGGTGKTSSAAPAWNKLLLAYAVPFSIWSVPQWLQQAADKWALHLAGNINGIAELAILTTALQHQSTLQVQRCNSLFHQYYSRVSQLTRRTQTFKTLKLL